MALVDHDQVDDGVVDLHLFQRHGDFGRNATRALQGTGSVLPARLQAIFAGCSPAIRWAVLRAGTGSYWVLHACATSRWNARQAAFCLVRKRFCSSSRMMRSTGSGKRPLPLPPPDRPGVQVCYQASTLPGATDQDIYLSPGQAQRLGCLIGGFMPDHLKRCQVAR
jgi:hypothetical protein